MTRFFIPAIVGLLLASTALPALAQNFQNLPLRNPRQPPEGYISVQSGISLSYSVPDGDNEEQQEKALKSFYKIAASSCDPNPLAVSSDASVCAVAIRSSISGSFTMIQS